MMFIILSILQNIAYVFVHRTGRFKAATLIAISKLFRLTYGLIHYPINDLIKDMGRL